MDHSYGYSDGVVCSTNTYHCHMYRYLFKQAKQEKKTMWNVRTLLDQELSANPELRTAIVAIKLGIVLISLHSLRSTLRWREGLVKLSSGKVNLKERNRMEEFLVSPLRQD